MDITPFLPENVLKAAERYEKVKSFDDLNQLIEEDYEVLLESFPPDRLMRQSCQEISHILFRIFDKIFTCLSHIEKSPFNEEIWGKVSLKEREEWQMKTIFPFTDRQDPGGGFMLNWQYRIRDYLEACEKACWEDPKVRLSRESRVTGR